MIGDHSIVTSAAVTGANPGIQRIIYYLDGQYLLTDFSPSYGFVLPSARWIDGSRVLEVEALMRDGFRTQ